MIREQIVWALADGEFHSGQQLADRVGVSRAAVWKHTRALRDWGLQVDAERGRGYRLPLPLSRVDPAEFSRLIAQQHPYEAINVLGSVSSTNDFLLRHPPNAERGLSVCVAEFQDAGRGRHGRRWLVPFGSGICLSVAYRFSGNPDQFAGITLGLGLAAREALRRECAVEAQLKWPNDIVCQDRKLGGILVEIRAEAHGRCLIVAGIGINVSIPDKHLAGICDWAHGAIDLRSVTGRLAMDKTRLSAAIAAAISDCFMQFDRSDLDALSAAWAEADYLQGKPVVIETADGPVQGVAAGIDQSGSLVIRTPAGARHVVSGEVRVRQA